MAAFITKHALTRGILRAEDKDCKRVGHDRLEVNVSGVRMLFHGLGKEWHLSMAAATECAERMRSKECGTLGRKLSQLHELSFERIGEWPA